MSVHFERALVLINLGRPAQAEEELRRVLVEQPRNSIVHRLLAWCLAQQSHLPQARAEAEEAIRLQPDSDYAHQTLGWILIQQHCWKEAEDALREAVRLNPRDAEHFFMLAYYFSQRKRWRDCEETARQGLRIDAQHCNCANTLAEALLHLNRPHEAQRVLKAVMAKDPENAWTHFTQGFLYQEQDKLEKALYHFREAARINPSNTDAHKAIRILGIRMGLAELVWGLLISLYLGYHLVNFLIDVFKFLVWGQRPKKQ